MPRPTTISPGKDADPALTSTLEDQILVDPALAQQSNNNTVRPSETPTQAQYPLPEQHPGMPVVTFTTSAPAERVLERYRPRARGGTGSAFYLILTPQQGAGRTSP